MAVPCFPTRPPFIRSSKLRCANPRLPVRRPFGKRRVASREFAPTLGKHRVFTVYLVHRSTYFLAALLSRAEANTRREFLPKRTTYSFFERLSEWQTSGLIETSLVHLYIRLASVVRAQQRSFSLRGSKLFSSCLAPLRSSGCKSKSFSRPTVPSRSREEAPGKSRRFRARDVLIRA